MRIAFITSVFPSLAETFILNQVTGLLDSGYDLTIFARADPHEKKVHPDIDTYNLIERTRYFDIPVSVGKRLAHGAILAARNLPRRPGAVARSLNVFRYGTPALSLTLLYAAVSTFEGKFDILHCHFGPNGFVGDFLRDKNGSAKLLVSFHGHDANSYPRTAGSGVYRRLFDGAETFTANTNFTKEQMVRLGCNADKITILPEGLRVQRFEFREKRPGPGETVKILTVGRLVEKKGHAYAIHAIARLAKDFPDLSYVVAGEGPLRKELERLADELGVGGRVDFLGAVDEAKVLELYRDCHIFLLPSVTAENRDREGQALVLQEAQVSGMPVVSTLHNGIPEGVLDGVSGYLVPEKDVELLTVKLKYLLEHTEIWPELGRAGRAFVEHRYDTRILTARLLEIYRGMLEGERL